MRNITSRCLVCGGFFDSKKELREHKDKAHRITNSKMNTTTTVIVTEKTIKSDTAKRHYQE